MARDAGRGRVGGEAGDDTGDDIGDETLEVRVLAIGPVDATRWLGRGRLPDGSAVDFVTDAAAAEAISDAMAAGADPIALIRRRQVLA